MGKTKTGIRYLQSLGLLVLPTRRLCCSEGSRVAEAVLAVLTSWSVRNVRAVDCCIVGIGQGYAAYKLSIRCNEVARRVGILEGFEYSVLEIFYQVDVLVLHGPGIFSNAIGLVTSGAICSSRRRHGVYGCTL